jgi:hypothetical protein
MADGSTILFDRPFYLSNEPQGKVNPLNRHFVDPKELEQDAFLDEFRPKQKNAKELLPHIQVLDELPTKTETIDFDRPFYMQSKETLQAPPKQMEKPSLPLPEPEPMEIAETQPQATLQQVTPLQSAEMTLEKPVIGVHRDEPKVEAESDLPQMFKGFVNMLGAAWAHIVDDIYKTRAAGHERTNETLQTYLKKRNHINQDFFENIDKIHENSKKEETWSFMYNIVEFLLISTGLIGGMGLVAAGVNMGEINTVYYGLEMMAGSVLSMGSFALKQLGYSAQYVGALGLSGALLTGWGIKQGFAVFGNNNLTKTLAAINDGALQLSKTFMNYVRLGTQKTKLSLEGSNNELNIERLKNYDDIHKTVGSFKMEDLIELSRAASEQMRMKGEIISRILIGSKT